MKNKCSIAVSFILTVLFLFSFLAYAGETKKSSKQRLTDGEQAGMRLLALEKKGFIEITDTGPTILIYVEPKFWKSGLHRDKHNLCANAWHFFHELDNKKASNYRHVGVNFYNMTTKEKLASVEMASGKIEIFK